MQVSNLSACGDARRFALARSPGTNRWIATGLAAELGLLFAVIPTRWGQALFGTAALHGWAWLLAIVCAACFLLLEELRKAMARRRSIPDDHDITRV